VREENPNGSTHDRHNTTDRVSIYTPGYEYCTHRIHNESVNPPDKSQWALRYQGGGTASGPIETIAVEFYLPAKEAFAGRSWVNVDIEVFMIRAGTTGPPDPSQVPEFGGQVKLCNDRQSDFTRKVGAKPPSAPPPQRPIAPQPGNPTDIPWPAPDYGVVPGARQINFQLCPNSFMTTPVPVVVADRKAENAVVFDGVLRPGACERIPVSTGESGQQGSVWVYRRDSHTMVGKNFIDDGGREEL
jgi:hypothetical protein